MDCLTGVVGVTRLDCECATGSLTPEEKETLAASSANFHYLDDIPTAVNIGKVRSTGSCKTFFNWSTEALSKAIKTLNDDLTAGLAIKYPQKQGAYRGGIGRTTFSGNLSGATKPLQFIKIEAASKNSDAVMSFARIKLFSSVAGATKLYVLDRDLNILHQVDNVMLNANTFTFIQLPKLIDLPLYHDNMEATYYFAWENVTGGVPKDNNISCGCPGGDAWTPYVTVTGGQADNMDELLSVSTDRKSHGIVVEVELKCITARFVCRQYSDKDAIAVVCKWAVAYKANEILVESILESREVDRYTLMDREPLYGKRNHYRAEYQSRIQYIIDNVDINGNSCFLCKDRQISIGSILS